MTAPFKSNDPFTRAYDSLRSELARAMRAPGEQIRVDETAKRFRISPTPVREALAQLCGERLVRGCRRQGWFVPRYSGQELEQLYTLAEMHVLKALSRIDPARLAEGVLTKAVEADDFDIRLLFVAALTTTREQLLADAGVLTIERVAFAARAECEIINTGEERRKMLAAVEAARRSSVAHEIRSYFRSRRIQSDEIVARSSPTHHAGYLPDIA